MTVRESPHRSSGGKAVESINDPGAKFTDFALYFYLTLITLSYLLTTSARESASEHYLLKTSICGYSERQNALKHLIISITRLFLIAFIMALGQTLCLAQQTVSSPGPSPPPTSPSANISQINQEPIRTLTEEVQLSVTALDSNDRLDPTLELADILVFEDDVAQEIRSARRVPAHVLLLLDTGGEINSAKRVRLTREIARRLVSTLEEQDEVSIMQFNSRVEILQNWTIDRIALLHVLDTKLLPGKRARFFDAVLASAAQLYDRPQGNRHVVMITDGVQTAGERMDRAAAFTQLQASNAVVHVISYTSVSRQTMQHQRRPTRKRTKALSPTL